MRFRSHFGDEHPDTLSIIQNMASSLYQQDQYEEALPLCREALAGRRHVLGNLHLDTLNSISDLGLILHGLGELPEAEKSC